MSRNAGPGAWASAPASRLPTRAATLGSRDEGYTDLLGPGRVPKYDPRVQVAGDVDEASSMLGLARALAQQPRVKEVVRRVQHDLYLLMAEVATPTAQVTKLPYRITP